VALETDLAARNGSDEPWTLDDLPEKTEPIRHRGLGGLLMLGQSQPWPVADDQAGNCGVCRGRELLNGAVVCLWCLRAGADAHLAAVPEPEVAGPTAYRPGRLAGGRGRAKTGKVKVGAEAPATRKRKKRARPNYR
jgi:hypothetical protein